MPLNTQVIRNGKELKIRWGTFHIAAMVTAAAIDSGNGPWEDNSRKGIYPNVTENDVMRISPKDIFGLVSYPVIATTPLNSGEYKLKNDYVFLDITDGEVFELKAGDILMAYRN